MKNTCKHKDTHKQFVSGTHKQYEIVVCNKCDKVLEIKTIK